MLHGVEKQISLRVFSLRATVCLERKEMQVVNELLNSNRIFIAMESVSHSDHYSKATPWNKCTIGDERESSIASSIDEEIIRLFTKVKAKIIIHHSIHFLHRPRKGKH
jgi:hypothetical protein